MDLRRQNELRNEKSVMTDENYGCKGQMKTMAARVRGKLWMQGTEENYGCKGQGKTMDARKRSKQWLQGTEEIYGCKRQGKNKAAKD